MTQDKKPKRYTEPDYFHGRRRLNKKRPKPHNTVPKKFRYKEKK